MVIYTLSSLRTRPAPKQQVKQYQKDESRRATIAPSVIHIEGPKWPLASIPPEPCTPFTPFIETTMRITNTTIITMAAINVMIEAKKSLPRRNPDRKVISMANNVRPRAIQYKIKLARSTFGKSGKSSTESDREENSLSLTLAKHYVRKSIQSPFDNIWSATNRNHSNRKLVLEYYTVTHHYHLQYNNPYICRTKCQNKQLFWKDIGTIP